MWPSGLRVEHPCLVRSPKFSEQKNSKICLNLKIFVQVRTVFLQVSKNIEFLDQLDRIFFEKISVCTVVLLRRYVTTTKKKFFLHFYDPKFWLSPEVREVRSDTEFGAFGSVLDLGLGSWMRTLANSNLLSLLPWIVDTQINLKNV